MYCRSLVFFDLMSSVFSWLGSAFSGPPVPTARTARCIAEYVSIVLLPFIFGAQKVVLEHRQTTLDSPAWRKVDLWIWNSGHVCWTEPFFGLYSIFVFHVWSGSHAVIPIPDFGIVESPRLVVRKIHQPRHFRLYSP